MLNILYISLGGALGALARYSLSLGLASKSMNFPTATLCTNIVGCFLMGMITEIFTLKANLPSELKLLIATGFLGAFTTFSTFGLESVSLINKAKFGKCFVYMTSSVLFGVSAIFAAVWLTRNILAR